MKKVEASGIEPEGPESKVLPGHQPTPPVKNGDPRFSSAGERGSFRLFANRYIAHDKTPPNV